MEKSTSLHLSFRAKRAQIRCASSRTTRKGQRVKECRVNVHHRLHRSRRLRLFTRRCRVGHFERLLRGLDGVGDGFVHGPVFFRLDDCSQRRRSNHLHMIKTKRRKQREMRVPSPGENLLNGKIRRSRRLQGQPTARGRQ